MNNLDRNCRVCMEWQEHCYWNHMPDDKKHFFKPMVGDFAETMSIPARFANYFNGHISVVIRLKAPSGRTWSVGVGSGTDEVVLLQSGWKEFVTAHGIDEGDCLLFKYTGVSSFDVLMFDSTGCEKTSPHFTYNHGCHRFKGAQDCTPQSLPSGGGGGDDAHLELALHRNTTSRSIPNRCKRRLHPDIEQAHGGEVKDDEDDDDLEQLHDGGERPARTGYYFCKNGPVSEYHLTEQEREEISSVRVPVEPRNPVFVQVMHPSHVGGKPSGVVAIPAEFASTYLGTAARDTILLHRASSKGTWHVRYSCNRFWRGLTGRGWCDFAGDNGILDHDVCLFELMSGQRRPTMTVHVLRKVRGSFVLLR